MNAESVKFTATASTTAQVIAGISLGQVSAINPGATSAADICGDTCTAGIAVLNSDGTYGATVTSPTGFVCWADKLILSIILIALGLLF